MTLCALFSSLNCSTIDIHLIPLTYFLYLTNSQPPNAKSPICSFHNPPPPSLENLLFLAAYDRECWLHKPPTSLLFYLPPTFSHLSLSPFSFSFSSSLQMTMGVDHTIPPTSLFFSPSYKPSPSLLPFFQCSVVPVSNSLLGPDHTTKRACWALANPQLRLHLLRGQLERCLPFAPKR
jgi:hypothetical protein